MIRGFRKNKRTHRDKDINIGISLITVKPAAVSRLRTYSDVYTQIASSCPA